MDIRFSKNGKYMGADLPPMKLTITPDMAKSLLRFNTKNYRDINWSKVQEYAAAMKAGRWLYNGESISISKTGRLINEQHRLLACIKADAPFTVVVVFDAEDTDITDVGYPRRITQILKASGIKTGAIGGGVGSIMLNGGARVSGVSKALLLDYIADNEEDILAAKSIVYKAKSPAKKAPCVAMCYCMMKTGKMPVEELREFFKVVATGNSAESNREASSALVLARQLREMKGGGQENQSKQLEITYKALVDFHHGAIRKRGYTSETTEAEDLINEVNSTKFQVLENAG